MHKTLLMTIVALAAAELFAIPGSITTDSETLTGDIKWQPHAKKYLISIKKVDREVPLADVVELNIAKPAGFDKAVQLVTSGQGAAAVTELTKIVAEYRMLQWDKPAARYLVQAYIDAGNAQKAFDACKPMIAEDKTAAYSGDLASAYWQALLKLGKNDELEKLLKKATSSGDRRSSAAAFVMRGDIIVAASNDQPEELKRALREGYLRVVLMYMDAPCAAERAEALQKAALCFDKLGQSSRAEQLRAQLKAM